jgi:RNA polymerase sigma-70 factor (ECF subfamily)
MIQGRPSPESIPRSKPLVDAWRCKGTVKANEIKEAPVVSFDSFFEAHYERTRRLLAVMLGDEAMAEESAQEAFARAFRDWADVSVMDRRSGWVLTVGLNHARDSLRRRKRAQRERWLGGSSTADDTSQRDLDLIDGLRKLPLRQRQAVVLRYLADLPLDEVATEMGCAVGTVKATLHKALAKLRIAYEETGETKDVSE